MRAYVGGQTAAYEDLASRSRASCRCRSWS